MFKLPIFSKETSGDIHFKEGTNKPSGLIFFGFFFTVGLIFMLIFFRLFQLTIVKGDYYRALSEQNRVRDIPIEAPRGDILDRKGFVVAKSLPPDTSKFTNITSRRIYLDPEADSSLIGYRQLANAQDISQDNCLYKLQPGQKVGQKGVEKVFDCDLRGVPGKKLIEVDASGKYLKTLDLIPPQKGKNVQLAFDSVLQKKAYQLLQGDKGALIAVNPNTGEILSWVSSPSFNSQDFEDNNSQAINNYLTDPKQPLFDRITEGLYPPGSLFKLAIATAALQEKAIDETTQFEDKGVITAGPLRFGNWYYLEYGKTDGMVDIVKAIQRSNDIFFYLAGSKVGENKIKKWAEILGYGQKTGIPFNEETGLIPDDFWKQETLHDKWYLGDTYNLSIGQGYLTVTPLQTVLVTSVFANGGYLCTPELLKTSKGSCKKLPISQKTIGLIREGMEKACTTGGTGWPLFDYKVNGKPLQTACKTGTAEAPGATTPPYAWITVFAPFDKPQIAVTVLVENGGQGSDVAGPIAKDFLTAYFTRNQ